MKKTFAGIMKILFLGVFLLACSPGAPESSQSNSSGLLLTATSRPDQVAAEPASPTSPTKEIETLAEPAPTATSTLVETAAPTVRTEQTASDPASFNLAAGRVQLVKFFAFW